MVIDATASPSKVANAVALSPLGPAGASTVIVGVNEYPVPPTLQRSYEHPYTMYQRRLIDRHRGDLRLSWQCLQTHMYEQE